ncbi:hypothetical protein MBLNU457_g0730t1 [Dothideomycetes sp. NU457]
MRSSQVSRLIPGLVLAYAGLTNAFWRMNCGVIQTGRVDPLVNPGAIAAHAHTIVGGSNIGVNATYESLLASECNSCEITADKSAYWTPLLYYAHNNGTFEEVPHGGSVIYYLGRGMLPDGSVKYTPFPKGFKMLSGNKAVRAYNQTGMTWGNATYPSRPIQDAVSFLCISDPIYPELPYMIANSSCTGGLRAQLHFQTCWNGIDLYKSDNSHVAHLNDIDNGVCPPGYPKLMPHLFIETDYSITSIPNLEDGGQFVLSMGDTTGYGFHGDFQNGWDMDIQEKAVAQCLSLEQDPSGTIDECPILMANDNTLYSVNCPEMPQQIGEPVHGLLDSLPGCVRLTSGPQAATAADMECPAGHPQPTITKTVDSTPLPTANPAIGSLYGNKYNRYLGCGNDTYQSSLGGLRLLNADSMTNDNMTIQMCQTYCTSNGYRLSGVEYGNQCFCDLTVNPTGHFYGGLNTFSGCNALCPGDKSQICGGPALMNVYNNTDPRMKVTNNTANSVIQMTAPVAKFDKNYIGCYSDNGPRTLNGTSTYDLTNMTVANCAAYCANANTPYYGVEYANQCYCGTGTSSGRLLDKSTNPGTSGCNYRCNGDFSNVCGGSGTISVYKNPAYVPMVLTPKVGKYASKGCLTDPGTNGRALAAAMTSSNNMTVANCVDFCQKGKYKYAGLEYASQCFCDNSIQSASGAKSTTCQPSSLMACSGDKYSWCGAGNLLQLYYSPTGGV